MDEKKILVLISQLYMGGFSKSLINFLLCIKDNKNIKIDLLILESESTELERDIPEDVGIIKLEKQFYKKKEFSNLWLFYHKCKYVFYEYFYKYVINKEIPGEIVRDYSQAKLSNRSKCMKNDFSFAEKYDCVISWEEGFCNYLLVDKIPAKYKVGFIHPNYKEAKFSANIDKYYIKKLDQIVTISESCYKTLIEVFPWAENKIVYSPNRLNYQNLEEKSKEYVPDLKKDIFSFLTVARVVDQDKAVFRIVDLSEKLKRAGFEFCWYIIGDGHDLPEVRKRIEARHLQENIVCVGELTNPCPYMKEVNVFVMQSHREGRPVAVDETLLLGTPALITKYSSAYEQINDNVTGWIVEDNFDDIYDKMEYILKNKEIVENIKKNVENMDKKKYEDCSGLLNIALNRRNSRR